MGTTYHIALSVRGALNWKPAEQRKALKWMFRDALCEPVE